MEWSYKEKFPVAVLILNFGLESQPAIKKLFSDDLLVEKSLSEQFRVYGINSVKYDL
jgi:hypothetical protein